MATEFTPCDTRDCAARALVTVIFDDQATLDFCGHHYDRSMAALSEVAYGIDDQRTHEALGTGA